MSDVAKAVALRQKLNQETAQIHWRELQRFFAQGRVLLIESELDLVDVGVQLALDNTDQFDAWVRQTLIAPVEDAVATLWTEDNPLLWAVVVAPWVLIQTREEVETPSEFAE